MAEYDPNFKPVKQYFIVGQKIVISNSENKILLLQRSSKSGAGGLWSVVGGGLEKGEKSQESILREVKEETQLEVNNFTPYYVKTYEHGEDSIVIIAYKAELTSGKVVLNWEHDDYKWVEKSDALKMELTPDARNIIEKWN